MSVAEMKERLSLILQAAEQASRVMLNLEGWQQAYRAAAIHAEYVTHSPHIIVSVERLRRNQFGF